jgi:hypothetical protein
MLSQNPYFTDFVDNVTNRFADDTSSMPNSEWVRLNTRLKKRPFSFEGHEFQQRILDDMHPTMSVIKCSQVGLTEIQLRKMLAFMKREIAVNVIFTLPNLPMRDRLSTTRILPLVNGEKVFNSLSSERPLRNKGVVQIDQSFAYLSGSTEGEATSVPADMILKDEVDLTDQAILGLYQSRLQHSSYKIDQAFSTPTFVGFGIDKMYENSDQHEYMYRCNSCNHWQVPQFKPRNIRFDGGRRMVCETIDEVADMTEADLDPFITTNGVLCCEACEKPLDLYDASLREWVPKFPTRSRRGYRVRPFSVGSISISYIIDQLVKYKEAGSVKGWYNTTLGEPFNDSSVRLAEPDIRACLKSATEEQPGPYEGLFLGVDAGQTCHIVMGTEAGRIYRWWTVPHSQLYDRIQSIMQDFNILGGAMDRHPYTPLAASIYQDSGARILPCVYSTNNDSATYIEKTDDLGQITHYVLNRTQSLDTVAGLVRDRKFSFLGYGSQAEDIVTQLRGMIRIEVAELAPRWEKIGDSRTNDHYFHALGLMLSAIHIQQRRMMSLAQEQRYGLLLAGTDVFTQQGTTLSFKSRIAAGSIHR